MPSQEKERTCVGCRRRARGEELIRFVGRDATLVSDLGGRLKGRGAHVCPTRQCLVLGVERGGFSRTLRQRIHVEDLGEFIADLAAAMKAHLQSIRTGMNRAGVHHDEEEAGRKLPAWMRRLRGLESAAAAFAASDGSPEK